MRMNKTIKENVIYEGRICRFTHNEVEFEDGSTGYRDVLNLAGAVAILAFDDDDNTFLVDQYRHAVSDQLLELPAGMLENNEDPVEAALRELEEETGYKSDNVEFLCDTYTAAAFCSEIVRIFVATNLIKGKQHFDRDEEVMVEEWKPDDLKKAIYEGQLKDGKTVSGLMTYFAKFNIK